MDYVISISMMRKFLFIFLSVIVLFIPNVNAQIISSCEDFGHFDLFIDIDPPAEDGGRIIIDRDQQFPRVPTTGTTIVPADFGDFAGGPHRTDDPGWVINTGGFEDDELLWFRALGAMQFWDRDQQRWLNAPPNGERVRYFGIVPPDIQLVGTDEEREFYSNGTIWTGNGFQGPVEGLIEPYVGGLHAHLDFCLEDSDERCGEQSSAPTGSPAVGAYLIEMQLFSTALASNGLQQKYFDSNPVKVMLNNGLLVDDCNAAIEALVLPVVDDSSPQPAAGVLIMSGP